MSMDNLALSTSRRNSDRIYMALLLARSIQTRRESLGLSIEEAAYVAGMEVSRWCAVEGGWVPAASDPLLRSIAETLEIDYHMKVCFYAEISRYNQSLSV
jgi:hypothetical protein